MQTMFRLPWCSEPKLGEKAHLDKMRPVVEIPGISKFKDLKRKRSDSSDAPSPHQAQPLKKQQLEEFIRQYSPSVNTSQAQSSPRLAPLLPAPPRKTQEFNAQATAGAEVELPRPSVEVPSSKLNSTVSADKSKTVASDSPAMATDSAPESTGSLTKLQQVIENEFNMQILMKHNELRLIEQELAKCQVALEQLRRCELRPYPGTQSPSLAVSEGVGPAINPLPGFSRPSHPPPHGVTDGPYSRHYRQWLLHDPQFDSISPEALAYAEAHANAAGRSTRTSFGHVRKPASKSLGTSTRASDPMQSIPNYPVAPVKDKSAPLVLKRSTDGQLVKLICKDCHRGNFSSIQGFLNHCRIAHKVDYKSHDAAAVDCGQLLDESDLSKLPPEAHATTSHAPKPSISRASTSAAATPAKIQTHAVPHGNNLVHPFNSSASIPVAPRPAPFNPTAPVPSLSSPVPSSFSSAPFKASSQTPRLSAFLQKHGNGGNLDQAVASAKQRVDLTMDEDMLSPDTPSETSSPVVPFGPGARTVGNQGYFPRPESRKGFRQPSQQQRPRPSPLAPAPPHDSHMESQLSSPQDLASAGLSPHTADSNPGMVSDHDDDDHSVSEEEVPQADIVSRPPLSTVGRTCSDEMDLVIEEDNIDGIDEHGVIIRRDSMTAGGSRKMGGK